MTYEKEDRLWITLVMTSKVTRLNNWSIFASFLLSAKFVSSSMRFSALSLKVPIRPLRYLEKMIWSVLVSAQKAMDGGLSLEMSKNVEK